MQIYTVTFSFGVLSVDVLVDAANRKAARKQAVAVGNANALSLAAVDHLFLAPAFGVGGVRISPPRFISSAIADVKEHVEVFAKPTPRRHLGVDMDKLAAWLDTQPTSVRRR